MTIGFDKIEKAISQRLDIVRKPLREAGVSLICLPKESGKYIEESNSGLISILIPQISGEGNIEPIINAQIITVRPIINLSLPLRYKDTDEEKPVLEFCAEQIIGLLLNWKPANLDLTQPFQLDSYELFRPEGSMWESQIRFYFQKRIFPITPDPDSNQPGIKEQIKIKLFAVLDLKPTEPTEFFSFDVPKKP